MCPSDAGGKAAGCALARERSSLSARRAFLRAALVLGAGLSLPPAAFAEDDKHDASALPPQPGDHFAYLPGDKEGEVKVKDLAVGGPQVMAYPMDPKSRLVRDGSRLNLVILMRFDPAVLSAETRANAAKGVVAYSAVCTHQGCPVSMWSTERKAPFCSCHGSIYDLKDGAQVLDGPAPRPLPALPVRLENGALAVAGKFTGRVGSQI
ncbi:MAG TPA: Rieske 2Fe-2S domain-containing protein [Stellaceae bacterium]|nr:Rieske 2Fe-2S domain-containing protein [Stellaceae bacterium]